ncbi:MAG: hypothetical protein VYD85_05915 [Pseudomonadota bacterium]|nr:hypothetical protein [Pseudomonadota bacterium]
MKLSGTDNWGEAQLLLDLIEAARSRGVDVHCDQYPQNCGTTPLRFLRPTWLQEGGMDAMLARLADPYSRSRVRQKIAEVDFNNYGLLVSSETIRIAVSTHGAAEPGQTIADIAKAQNLDELDAVLTLSLQIKVRPAYWCIACRKTTSAR